MDDREIDFLIFEHIFENEYGFVEYLKKQKEELDLNLSIVRRYSTDIKDAWKVVEQLQNKWNVNVGTANPYSKQMGKAREVDKYYCEVYGERNIIEFAETVPLAICKAALKIIGVEI